MTDVTQLCSACTEGPQAQTRLRRNSGSPVLAVSSLPQLGTRWLHAPPALPH
eukprot:COSAG03_NODE_19916_length_327_cov_1.587719_1_plen_51_part_10